MGDRQDILYLAVWKLNFKHLGIKTYGAWVSVCIFAQIPQIRGGPIGRHAGGRGAAFWGLVGDFRFSIHWHSPWPPPKSLNGDVPQTNAKALTPLKESGAECQKGEAPTRRGAKETKREEIIFRLIVFIKIEFLQMCHNLSMYGNRFIFVMRKSFPSGACSSCFTEPSNHLGVLTAHSFRFHRSGLGPELCIPRSSQGSLCCWSEKRTLRTEALQ